MTDLKQRIQQENIQAQRLHEQRRIEAINRIQALRKRIREEETDNCRLAESMQSHGTRRV